MSVTLTQKLDYLNELYEGNLEFVEAPEIVHPHGIKSTSTWLNHTIKLHKVGTSERLYAPVTDLDIMTDRSLKEFEGGTVVDCFIQYLDHWLNYLGDGNAAWKDMKRSKVKCQTLGVDHGLVSGERAKRILKECL